MAFQLPKAARLIENPSAEELQQMTAGMPTARWTKYGNVNVQTRVLARATPSTFIVADDPDPGVERTRCSPGHRFGSLDHTMSVEARSALDWPWSGHVVSELLQNRLSQNAEGGVQR